MNKVLVGLVMVSSLAISGMAAEKSGAFVGVDLGASIMKFKWIGSSDTDPEFNFSDKFSGVGPAYGLKGGYKYFINDSFGVRGYTYLSMANSKMNLGENNENESVKLSTMNYGVGVDALYNFTDSFGAFAGISLGATKFSIKWPTGSVHEKVSETQFNAAVNLGVRTILADVHGIELGVGIPLKAWEYRLTMIEGGVIQSIEDHKINTQAEIKASYIFNF